MLRNGFLLFVPIILVAQVPGQVRVEGRILGPDAKPLPGAMVALVVEHAGPGCSTLREQPTDAQGCFRLECVPGRYGLTVTAPGCLPHFRDLELKAGAPVLPQEIHLKKGGYRIHGLLLCENGHNLEYARVAFSKIPEGNGEPFFASVRKGEFDITLAPGDYQAVAEAKGQAGGQRFEVHSNQPNAFIQLRAAGTPANPEVLAWIKHNAIPLKDVEAGMGFADMQPLKALIGDAMVVGLGEATHGTHEFFKLKHRMLEFLATELGFTVFTIEANLPESFAVNKYVLTGEGDPAKALAGLHFWTWNTEEVLDLIRWMRAYNADPQHAKKLRFYGVDMQYEAEAFAQAKAWLDGADPAEAAHLLAIKDRVLRLRSQNSEIPATEDDRLSWDAIARDVEAMISRLEARKFAGDDFDRQRQNLRVLAQFATMHGDPTGNHSVRDASMAANLRWIQAREQGAKVVLWAHNLHISRAPRGLAGKNSLGWHLCQSLGKAYLPIGFVFREGGFQAIANGQLRAFEVKPQAKGTLDAALAATGHSVLALDLRNRPAKGPVGRWLESPQGTWSIGALFSPEYETGSVMQQPLTEAYDALLFVNRTTHARPMPSHSLEQIAKDIGLKEPVNLDFKNGLKGWSMLRGNTEGYTTRTAHSGVKEGGSCLQVTFEGAAKSNLHWAASQTLDATAYRGKRVRLSGRIRTDGKPDSKAVFWLRVHCSSGKGFLDKMKDRPVTNTEWTEVTLEGPVAEDAVILDFGCMAMGIGTAWFDGIQVETLP